MILDGSVAVLIAIWLLGGISWQGQRVLSHGADLRRAALLIVLLFAWFSPQFRKKSIWIRGARGVAQALESRDVRWTVIVGVYLWATVLAILQGLALRYPLWDVGLYHQIIWSVAHGHGFLSTISLAGNYLFDHLTPTFAFLVPFFWLSDSSPLTLPVIQIALIFIGISAWVYFAERAPGVPASFRSKLAAATTVFAIAFESFWGNERWGFHDTSLAFPALSWAFVLILLDSRRRISILFLLLFAAATKEIILVDVSFALLSWAGLKWKSDRGFSFGLIAAAASLLGVFFWFEHLPHPEGKNYFIRYYSYLGTTTGEFFKNLILSPWKVFQEIGTWEIFKYLNHVFLPWLFLPILLLTGFKKVKKDIRLGIWVLAILPSLASAVMSTDRSLRGMSFHYVMELWPILAVLTLIVLSRVESSRWIWTWALLSVFLLDHDPWRSIFEFAGEARANSVVRSALNEIPKTATVSASDLAGPWVASRKTVTRWGAFDVFPKGCPDWIVLQGMELTESTPGFSCQGNYIQILNQEGWRFYHY